MEESSFEISNPTVFYSAHRGHNVDSRGTGLPELSLGASDPTCPHEGCLNLSSAARRKKVQKVKNQSQPAAGLTK
jgi:hypothetical protein